jgi:hypothetical protein
MKIKVFIHQAISRPTHHNATHSSCNTGRYENASCGKCVMLLSERSLEKKKKVGEIFENEKKGNNLED